MNSLIQESQTHECNQSVQKYLFKYYKDFFPYEYIYKFINNSSDKNYLRDIAIFACKDEDNLICIRPFIIDSLHTFKSSIINRTVVPFRLDIGALINQNNTKNEYIKEFVLDIDLSDFDDIRSCCKEKNMCDKCWVFIKCSSKIVKYFFNEILDCKSITYVFSGGRGLHIWVSDEKVMTYNSRLRQSIIKYFSLPSKIQNKSYFSEIFKEELFNIAINSFDEIVKSQKIFDNKHLISLLIDLLKFYNGNDYSTKTILDLIKYANTNEDFLNNNFIKEFISKVDHRTFRDFLLYITFPRFDFAASTNVKHLLKTPFSVHQKTKNICVVLSEEMIDEFKLKECPNLLDLESNNIFQSKFNKFINHINFLDSHVNENNMHIE